MMKVIPPVTEYADRQEYGALVGATESVAGIRGCLAVLHGVQGCTINANHHRTGGPLVAGNIMPVVETGIGPMEPVQGRNVDLVVRLARKELERRHGQIKLVWIFTGDGPSIIEDDIARVASILEAEFNIPVIPIDTSSGFLGGHHWGAEQTWRAALERFGANGDGEKRGINLLGPQLMGSNNWPNDIAEMERLLRAADVEINHVLFRDITVEQLPGISNAKVNYILSSEDFSDFEDAAEDMGMETWGQDLILPIGVYNTEQWYLTIAKEFGDVEKAKAQLKDDMDGVSKILRQNYNSTWALQTMYGKHVAVLGWCPFAAAMARCLFYDFNIRPVVIGLLSETGEAFESAKKLLEPMSEFVDFEVMENPTIYAYGEKIKEAGVDFSIGMRQDKCMTEGAGIPHCNLSGQYQFNRFNFVPWPYYGIRGMLSLLSELWAVMDQAVFNKATGVWQLDTYHPRDEGGNDEQ